MIEVIYNEKLRRAEKVYASKSIYESMSKRESCERGVNREVEDEEDRREKDFVDGIGNNGNCNNNISKYLYLDKIKVLLLNGLIENYKIDNEDLGLPVIYYSKDVVSYLESKLLPHHDRRFIKRHIVKILFVISCIYFRRVTGFGEGRKGDKTYYNIPYRLLAGVVGQRHYPKIMEILAETGVIECDEHFIYNGPKGKGCESKKKEGYAPGKAYGYKLNDRFQYSKFKALPTHLKIGRHMLKFKNEDHKHLINSMHRASLPVEIAQEIVAYAETTEKSKELQFHLINQFQNKQFFQSVSEKTERVFNNISSFQRDIRCLIRLDEEETTEIDISGSQPLLLNTFYSYNCKEKEKFKQLTESGKFYEVLAKETELTHLEKRQFKDEVYRILFGPMIWKFEIKIKEWFQINYPILWGEIEKLKLTHHSVVPIQLQKMEARVVINGVVGKFRKNNLPILTIHDSFMVRRKDAEFLKSTIIQEFQKMYDLTPRLKEETKFKEMDCYWEVTESFRKASIEEKREILKRYCDDIGKY